MPEQEIDNFENSRKEREDVSEYTNLARDYLRDLSGDGHYTDYDAHTHGSCRGKDFRDIYSSDYSEKVIISSCHKLSLLRELERYGICKATLFPELDKYAEYIKEKYKNN